MFSVWVVSLVDQNLSHMFLNEVSRVYIGLYYPCQTQIVFGKKESPIIVYGILFADPPRNMKILPQAHSFSLKDELRCFAEANPSANFTWTNRLNGDVHHGQTLTLTESVVGGGRHLFEFICLASNEYGSTDTSISFEFSANSCMPHILHIVQLIYFDKLKFGQCFFGFNNFWGIVMTFVSD